MIKNKKRLNKIKNQVSVGVLAGISCLLLSGSIFSVVKGAEVVNDLDEYLDNVRSKQEYVEYISEKSSVIYEEYKSGNIDANAFNNKMAELKSDDHIYNNANKFLDQETCSQIEDMRSDTEKLTGMGLVSLLASASVGMGAISQNWEYKSQVLNEKRKELQESDEEKEM